MEVDAHYPGEKLKNEILAEKIRSKINEMLNWKRKGFPGSNPVSLTKYNVQNIIKNEYLICEKTDGIRYFLFVASGTTFFINRNYEIYKNDIHIPLKDDLTKHQQLTLLDGELVEDIIYNKHTGKEEKRFVYLIYDGLYIHRKNITKCSYLERLQNVYNFVIAPLREYKKDKSLNIERINNSIKQDSETDESNLVVINSVNADNVKNEKSVPDKFIDLPDVFQLGKEYPVDMYLKDFYTAEKIKTLVQIMKKLPHPTDGIIFTPLRDPYVTGNCFTLLKWKPSHLNTVDFSVEPVHNEEGTVNNFELFISSRGIRSSYNCYLAPYGDVFKELLHLALDNKVCQQIVECYYVPHSIFSIRKNSDEPQVVVSGGWVAHKIRFDKNIPNDVKTINKVIQSIHDNITLDTLVKELGRKKKNDIFKINNT